MTNSKSSKRAFVSSAIAVFLCVVMLIGTTFAWFTDTAKTGINRIQAGTLDIELQMKDGQGNWIDAEGKTLDFKKSADAPEGEAVLWEPGCTYELPELRVVNKGNLALVYKIVVSGINGDEKLLKAIEFTGLDNLEDEGHLLPGEDASVAIKIKGHMKEDAGNEYQGLSAEGISVTVYATQDTVEYDSFDNQYDADASKSVIKATPETIQSILDGLTGPAVVELSEGDYGRLYLRQAKGTSAARDDLKKSDDYPAYYREIKGLTLRAAAGAKVTCKGITAEAGTLTAASNKADFGGNIVSYLLLESTKIEGISFTDTTTNVLFMRDNYDANHTGTSLLVNGFTVKDCKGVGSGENKPGKHFFYGSSASDLPFCNAAGGKAGYNDIRIIGCELSKYYQPICWNNKTSVLNGLTVSGNTFTDCIHNHVQVTNKINSGKFVFENNRLVNVGNNKFIRIEKLQDGSAVTIKGTKIENAGVNNNIVRIDGVSSNFTVDASDNQWAKGFFPLWEGQPEPYWLAYTY